MIVLLQLCSFVVVTMGVVAFSESLFFKMYVNSKKSDFTSIAETIEETIGGSEKLKFDAYQTNMLNLSAGQISSRIIVMDTSDKVIFDSKGVLFGRKYTKPYIDDMHGRSSIFIDRVTNSEHIYRNVSSLPLIYSGRGDKYLIFADPLRSNDKLVGNIVIEHPAAIPQAYLDRLRRIITTFFISCFFIVFTITTVVTNHNLITPLRKMRAIMSEAVDNDFDPETQKNFTIQFSYAEIMKFARTFFTTLSALKKKQESLKTENQSLINLLTEQNTRAEAAAKKQKLLEFDLRLAHNIQQELLPQVYPKIDGVTISAANFQVGEIGGDCFDFYKFDDDRLGAFIGDVSGKGIAAAIVMSMVTILFSQLKDRSESPGHLLTKVNEVMYRHFGLQHSIFMTCFFLAIDSRTNQMLFSSAGHNPPYLYRKNTGEIISIESEGFGLGMFPKVIYEEKTLDLQPGDKLILYTDGVIDTRNPEGTLFSSERLVETIRKHCDTNCYRLTHLIIEDLEEYAAGASRTDDMTIIVIEISEKKTTPA